MQQRIRFEMNYASDAVITRANIEEEAACSTLHFSCFENQLSGIAIKMSTNINLKFNKNARALITHFYLHALEYLITNFPLYGKINLSYSIYMLSIRINTKSLEL